jgi:hypothetical protein
MALAAGAASVQAQGIAIVNGDHWTKSSTDVKKAYLLGIKNLLQVELEYFGNNQPSDTQSFVPRMARGLRGETLDSVRTKLDGWYAANPSRLSRPVLEVMWAEIIVPKTK